MEQVRRELGGGAQAVTQCSCSREDRQKEVNVVVGPDQVASLFLFSSSQNFCLLLFLTDLVGNKKGKRKVLKGFLNIGTILKSRYLIYR
jgi:hypothetical protein